MTKPKRKKRARKPNDWAAIYRLGCLLYANDLITGDHPESAGVRRHLYSATKAVEMGFARLQKTLRKIAEYQFASVLSERLARIYEEVQNGMEPSHVERALEIVLASDETLITLRAIVGSKLDLIKLSKFNLSQEQIRIFRGNKESAAIKVGEVLGIKIRTIQTAAKRAKDFYPMMFHEQANLEKGVNCNS